MFVVRIRIFDMYGVNGCQRVSGRVERITSGQRMNEGGARERGKGMEYIKG